MDNTSSSFFQSRSLRHRMSAPVGDPEIEALSDIRTDPYFPTVKAPQREKILHPVLMTAYVLEPLARPEYHIRLHPVLACADLRSRYSSDPEVHIPRPLSNSSDSRRSSTSAGSTYRRSKGKRGSSTIGTSVADSIEHESSPIARAIMDEIDAEIAIRLSNTGQPQRTREESEMNDWEDNSEEKPNGREAREMQRPEMRGLFVPHKPDVFATQTAASNQSQLPADSQHIMARVSISNLRELTVAEANARVQAFRASSEYQVYHSEQKRIFDRPWCAHATAKDRVAEFKSTPSWRRYAADVALILEHGDANDVAIISASHSSPSSSAMPKDLLIGQRLESRDSDMKAL